MANLQEKIAGLFPSATFEQEGDGKLRIVIPHDKLHSLVKDLRDNHRFDYLITIVGMDWKTSLGCIYYLTSSVSSEVIAVKTSTDDRDKPMLPSIADLYRIAEFYEREVYDFFGIIFVGNPDMRRLFLNIDWKGFPLRKDYDANPELNPVSIEAERQSDFTDQWVRTESGEVKCNRRRVFAEDDFVVNIGPQHPATHGVLRFRTAVDGETIKKIDVYMGYIHRGVEKLCEDLAYMQTLHFMDRLDYFSAHNYHHGLCLCIEKAAGIEVPRRAQVIRVMMDELSRIASHCLFLGTFCMDLGATTMLFYTLRVREQILDIMERTCGARMTFNYDCLGGVMQDLDENFVSDVKELLAVIPKNVKEYNKIFTGNVIARGRMEGVGVLSHRMPFPTVSPAPRDVLPAGLAMCARLTPMLSTPSLISSRLSATRATLWLVSRTALTKSSRAPTSFRSLSTISPKGSSAPRCPRCSSCLRVAGSSWWKAAAVCSAYISRATARTSLTA